MRASFPSSKSNKQIFAFYYEVRLLDKRVFTHRLSSLDGAARNTISASLHLHWRS